MRRLLPAALAALLLLAPTAAFAQDAVPEPAPEEPTAVQTLIDTLTTLALDVAGIDDPDLVAAATDLLGEVLDTVTFAAVVADAEDGDGTEVEQVVAALEDDDEGTEAEDGDAEEGHGALVSQVAHCAPRGQVAKQFFNGYSNHGAFVSAAANGTTTEVTVPVVEDVTDPETGDTAPAVTGTQTVTLDFSSQEGVDEFCALVAAIEDAAAALHGTDDVKEAAHAARDEARDEAKAERDATRDEAKAERDATRDEAKAERQAARDAAKAERDAARAERHGDDD